MKRRDLIRHLQKHGCVLEREGGRHSIWLNPANGLIQAVPRPTEIGTFAVGSGVGEGDAGAVLA